MKIAIASGKGGTGKTTLAVNLALRAAEFATAALLDLDVEEPNSGIFIQGRLIESRQLSRQIPQWDKAACTLCGRCAQVCQYHAVLKLGPEILILPELCHSCFACSELCPADALPMRPRSLGLLRHWQSGKLSFVESKLDIGLEMASPLIRQTLDYARRDFPDAAYQFRDCPPGTSCSMIAAVKDADLAILVTEPTPFGLYDLSLAVETTRQLHKPTAVVVNRHGIGNDDVYGYCAEQDLPVWASIPNRREIAEIYSRGGIIYPEVPEFRLALDDILARLAEQSVQT